MIKDFISLNELFDPYFRQPRNLKFHIYVESLNEFARSIKQLFIIKLRYFNKTNGACSLMN